MPITHHVTRSTMITQIEYDSDKKLLTLTFGKGGKYKYEEVPKEVYEALINAVEAVSCSDPNCHDPNCNYDNEPAPSTNAQEPGNDHIGDANNMVASPQPGRELEYTSTNKIAACRCGSFPTLYGDGARPDDGYRSLWCQTCMVHVTEMIPSEREVIDHWNELREREHAAPSPQEGGEAGNRKEALEVTESEAMFVAGRLRGVGVITREVGGYGQLTHEAVRKVLIEFLTSRSAIPHPAPAKGDPATDSAREIAQDIYSGKISDLEGAERIRLPAFPARSSGAADRRRKTRA